MYKIYADGELLCDSRIDELALISPNGSLAANVAGEFSFTIPSTHPKYNLIKIKSTVVRIFRDDEKNPMMEAIAVNESVDFFKNRTIQCEGALSFLNDTILRPSLRNGYTVEQLLTAYINEHNAQVGKKKKFCVGRVTVSTSNLIYTSTNMTSTFEQIKSDLLDDLGGYMMVRYEDGERFIDYLATAVETCEQKIELGKNLLDYKSNIDSENFATRVIPLGATLEDSQQTLEGVSQRLTISSVNGGRDFVCNTEAEKVHDVTEKTIVFDDVTDQAELMAEGDAYLRSIQFRDVYIEAKAIDFGYLTNKIQKFSLLKRVNVLSSAHGLDGYFMLTKMDFELNSPENDVFVFGSTEAAKMQSSKTLSAKSQETIHEVENQIEEIHEDVGGLKVTLEKTDEGLLAEVSNRQNADNEMLTKVSQTAHSIALVASGGDNSVGITIQLYDENGNLIDTDSGNANINIVGFVTFSDLAGEGTTIINGNNITTGTISADRIDTETLVAKSGAFNKSFAVGVGGSVSGTNLTTTGAYMRATEDSILMGLGLSDVSLRISNREKHFYGNCDYAKEAGKASSAEYADSATDATNATNATYLKNGVYVYVGSKGNFIPSSSSIACGTKTNPFRTGWTAEGWQTTSDERLKKDFVSLKDDQRFEAMFYLLDPMEYKFKNDENGKVHVGFSAQKVKTAMDSAGIEENEFFGYIHEYSDRNDFDSEEAYEEFLVRNNGNSDCYGLSYQEFIPINTCMIQKQHQEIESLKQENLALQNKLSILESRMEELYNVINNQNN